MDDIIVKSIDSLEQFTKWGATFVRVGYNPKLDIYVYERRNAAGKPIAWELIRPRLRNGIRCYPSTEEFGRYGKCVSATDRMRKRMENLLNNGW